MIMPVAKRKRITITASLKGIGLAENALVRLGFGSKSNFAEAQLLGKSTVDRFFNKHPLQLDSFKRICEALKIEDWRSIAELEPVVEQIERYQPLVEMKVVEPIVAQAIDVKPTATRRITVSNKQSEEIEVDIVLEGNIDSIDDNFEETCRNVIRAYSGDTTKIINIQSGSIRITIQGSPKGVARLIDRFTSGELTEVNGFPVEDIQILSQDFLEETEEHSFDNKWDLVREILSHPVQQGQFKGTNLSDADLSDADLGGADLSDADLSDADLSDADLSGANLQVANLSGADLSGANLSGADLSGANLSGADLSGADLQAADLSGANLSGADLSGADLQAADLAFGLARAISIALAIALATAGDIDINRNRDDIASAFTIALAIARDLTLDLDRAMTIDRARATSSRLGLDLDLDLDLDLNFALDIDIARNFARERALDIAGTLHAALDLALDRASDHASDLHLALDRASDRASKLHLALDRVSEFHHVLDRASELASAITIARTKIANFSSANLSNAMVENAQFGKGVGLSESEKLDLKRRGAIFNDATSDRSPVNSPSPVR